MNSISKKLMTLAAASMGLALAPHLALAEAVPFFDCWDGTFAYTRVDLTRYDEQDDLLGLTISTESQRVFSTLISPFDAKFDGRWGIAKVSLEFSKQSCQIDAAQPALLSCHLTDGVLYLEYDLDASVHITRRIWVHALDLTTQQQDGGFVTDLSVTDTSGVQAHLALTIRNSYHCKL